jgi:hypothetical protein
MLLTRSVNWAAFGAKLSVNGISMRKPQVNSDPEAA